MSASPAKPARRLSRRQSADLTIYGLCAVSGLLATTADTTLTGWMLVDRLQLALYGAAVPLLAASARRWSWIVLAGAAAVAGLGSVTTLVVGGAALTVAVVSAAQNRRHRRLGALIGALAAQALLHAGDAGPFGTATVLAIVGPGACAISAWRLQDRSSRAARRRWLVWCLLGLSLVGAGAAVALVQAVPAADRGVSQVKDGVAAMNRGDAEQAAHHLALAEASFAQSRTAARSPISAASRVLPGVNAHLDAVALVAGVGEELSGTAAESVRDADYGSIGIVDGRVDLDRFGELRLPLVDVELALEDADRALREIDTDHLVAPASSAVSALSERVQAALPTTRQAISATELAPGMLGGDGTRRWLIGFTTPAEARGIGGFLGYYTEITADDGDLEITNRGRVPDLNRAGSPETRVLEAPEDFLSRYGRFHPERNLQDISLSPDFPSVAMVFESQYFQATGRAVDGMVLLDPIALAELLRITGPITTQDGTVLDKDNATEFFLRDQYLVQGDREKRAEVFDEVAQEVFERLLDNRLRDPVRMVRLLAPLVSQRRVMAHSSHEPEQELFAQIGLDGSFPVSEPTTDFVSVINQNAGNNKLDAFLHRTVTYDPTYDPATGAVEANLDIKLLNTAVTSELPEYVTRNREDLDQPAGVNWTWLTIHTPLLLQGAWIDGEPVATEPQREFGWNVYAVHVAVPPGDGIAEVRFALEGSIEPSSTYSVRYQTQPLSTPDDLTVAVTAAPGWRTDDPPETVLQPIEPTDLSWAFALD